MQTLGDKIYKLRKSAGWSQEELGEKIGVSRQAISQWETNAMQPKADNIKAMCVLFNVTSDYLLFDGEEDKKEKNESEGAQSPFKNKVVLIGFILGIVALIAITLVMIFVFVYPKYGNNHVGDITVTLTSTELFALTVISAVSLIVYCIIYIIKRLK